MIFNEDCLAVMKRLPENSVDAVVTDPPYGIRFMGKSWDGADIEKMQATKMRKDTKQTGRNKKHEGLAFAAGSYDLTPKGMQAFMEFSQEWSTEALRILKPGGHLLAFASCRTYHRMACGVEMAGFEIRDQMQWLFGSGFPKSLNLGGAWTGWGTALKPSNEPIVMARKPISEDNIEKNVLKWGTGAINIDANRIAGRERTEYGLNNATRNNKNTYGADGGSADFNSSAGRWPSNVILNPDAANILDEQCAGASRFFYCAKSSKVDRNHGLDGIEAVESGFKNSSGRGLSSTDPHKKVMNQNFHPTVKPVKLMAYLINIVTPPGGVILDPFMGSGSTGVAAQELGFEFLGCEISKEYFKIAENRLTGTLFGHAMEAP